MKYLLVAALSLGLITPTLAQQKPPTGYEYLSAQLATANKDVANLLDENAALRRWHDECVKDFKKCQEEHEKAAAVNPPASPPPKAH